MKSTEKFLPKCLKPNVSKKKIHMKQGHRTVFQNAWSQKKLTFPLKKITLFQESLKIRIKKVYRTVFQNAWSQKNKHSHWKNNSVPKNLWVHMKKGHRTVFQNPWSQKNKHSHWKNNSVSKKALKFTEPSYKMPEAKKTNIPIAKKSLCFKKA